MGRHVAVESPEVERIVEEAVREIGAEVEALAIPKLWGVVLGGGYGRGEGGVIGGGLSNDLDFYVVAEEGAGGADLAAIDAALKPVSEKWTAKLGVDVDFCTAKTPWRIRHDENRLMIQELLHGYFDVAGERGETMFASVKRLDPGELPWIEAARLLMNRGAGLLLAGDRLRAGEGVKGFVARNINKAVLGAGDARLIARGAYRWRAVDRAEALGDALYSKAVEWKFRPADGPVCDIAAARAAWTDALDEVFRADGAREALARRTFYNAARWIIRRRTIGEFRTLGLDPVVRVLAGMREAVEEGKPFSPGLKKDWIQFN